MGKSLINDFLRNNNEGLAEEVRRMLARPLSREQARAQALSLKQGKGIRIVRI